MEPPERHDDDDLPSGRGSDDGGAAPDPPCSRATRDDAALPVGRGLGTGTAVGQQANRKKIIILMAAGTLVFLESWRSGGALRLPSPVVFVPPSPPSAKESVAPRPPDGNYRLRSNDTDKEVAPRPPDGNYRLRGNDTDKEVAPLPPDGKTRLRSNDAHKEVAPRPPDGKYRLVTTRGCSGSSFVAQKLKEILSAHGYVVAKGKTEIYKPSKNIMFERAKELAPVGTSTGEIVGRATVMLQEANFKKGEILLAKWLPYALDQFVDRVGRENVLFGGMVRENVLDRMVCQVRDCFGSQRLGYPVLAANGSKTDLCFKRRSAGEGGRTKAHFQELGAVVEHLRNEACKVADLKERGGEATYTYEELVAYEYTDDDRTVAASMAAWCHLAGRFVDGGLDCGIVDRLFRSEIGSRKRSYHEDVIDNYEEVFKALRKAGLGRYIRSRVAEEKVVPVSPGWTPKWATCRWRKHVMNGNARKAGKAGVPSSPGWTRDGATRRAGNKNTNGGAWKQTWKGKHAGPSYYQKKHALS